jgi:hypothetical protein
MAKKKKFEPTAEELKEWNEIEDLVIQYQKSINGDKETCKNATNELLIRFMPLFKKYILLIKHNQLDFNDMEQKSFTSLFIEDKVLRRMLNRKVTPVQYKSDIYQKSNFIRKRICCIKQRFDVPQCAINIKIFIASINTIFYFIQLVIKSFYSPNNKICFNISD